VPLTVFLSNTSAGLVDSIAWDLNGDGNFNDATGPTATQTFTTAGDHTVGLSVTGPGGTSTTSQAIPATLPPPPIAVLRAQPTSGVTPLIVSLNGCASAGEITTFAWDFDSNGIVDQTGPCTTELTFSSPGSFTVTLLVTGPGGTATASQTIAANANTPRNLTITAPESGASFPAMTTVTFTGSAMDTEDGNISSSIQWSSSANGALGTGASISVSTLLVGNHTIIASVTDGGGAPAMSSITITVNPAPASTTTTTTPAQPGGGGGPCHPRCADPGPGDDGPPDRL
jgi:PKD repeat protein